jgi:hypothetical protein
VKERRRPVEKQRKLAKKRQRLVWRKKKPTPKETEAVAEPKEVPEGAPDEETFGATEDRTGEQRLAMRRHRQRKKRAQKNGRPQQKFAAFRGQFTLRAVPAMRKGHVRRGLGKRCCHSGIGRRSKASCAGKRGETESWLVDGWWCQ